MANLKNGQKFMVTYALLSVSLVPSTKSAKHAGKYPVSVVPDQYNEKGIFMRSDAQLRDMANTAGVSSWRTLARAIAKGDAQLHVEYEWCAEGEASPDDPTIVYTSDWAKPNRMTVELSPAGDEYIDKVTSLVDVKAETDSIADANQTAKRLRMALLTGIKNVDGDPEPEPEPETEIEEEGEEGEGAETLVAAAKPATAKRK